MANQTKTCFTIVGAPAWDVLNASNLTANTGASALFSSYTEANLGWDLPIPATTNAKGTDGRFLATPYGGGTPTAIRTLTLTVQAGGYPNEVARFIVADTSVTYGWSDVHILTGITTVSTVPSSGDGYQLPRAVALDNGGILLVYEDYVGNDGVKSTLYSASTELWAAAATVWTTGSPSVFTSTDHPSPEVVRIPIGGGSYRIICFFWEQYDVSTAVLNAYYTEDSGTTWSLMARRMIDYVNSSNKVDRTQCVYDSVAQTFTLTFRGLEGGTYYLYHYLSTDGGTTWQQIEILSGIRGSALVLCNGVVTLLCVTADGQQLTVRRKASASDRFNTITLATTTDTWEAEYIAATVDPSGRILVYLRDNAAAGQMGLLASWDGGFNWGPVNGSWPPSSTAAENVVLRDAIGGGTLTSGLKQNGAVISAGRGDLFLFGNFNAATGTNDNTVMGLRFGGWTTITERIPYGRDATTDQIVYLPFDMPTDRGWTTTGAGTDTLEADTDTDLVYTATTSGNTRYHSFALSSNGAEMRVHAIMRCIVGGSDALNRCSLRAQVKTTAAATNYAVEIRFATTGFRAWDGNTAAALGTAVAIDLIADDMEFLVAVNQATAKCYYKRTTSRTWIEFGSTTGLTTAAGGTTTLDWGNIASGTVTSQWKLVAVIDDADDIEDGLATADMTGAPAALEPFPYDSTAYVRWTGGPLLRGNTYTLRTRSRTAATRIFAGTKDLSPRSKWASAVGSVSATHRWVWNAGENDARIGEVSLLAVVGTTARYWRFYSYNAGFNQEVELDMADTALTTNSWAVASLNAPNIVANASTQTTRTYFENELKGQNLALYDGTTTWVGPILHNSEGQWTSNASAKAMVITLDVTNAISGAWSAMASSGGGSGYIHIYWRDALVLFTSAASNEYFKIDCTQTAWHTTAEAGKVMMCRAVFLAKEADAGWQESEQAQGDVFTGPGGYVTSRRRSESVRTISQPFRQINHHGDRYAAGTALTVQPTAGVTATERAINMNNADMATYLVRELGNDRPCIFVPDWYMTTDPSTDLIIRGGRKWIYGLFGGSAAVTGVQGQRYGESSRLHIYDLDALTFTEIK